MSSTSGVVLNARIGQMVLVLHIGIVLADMNLHIFLLVNGGESKLKPKC